MGELFNVLTVKEARALLAKHLPKKKPGVKTPVLESLNRRLAVEIMYKTDAPGLEFIVSERAAGADTIFPAGHRIRPQDLVVLSCLGLREVEVKPPVRVGIISTGDELVDPEESPGPGQVRDINSYTLYGAVTSIGGEASLYGQVQDSFEELRIVLMRALGENDMVLLSGGSSVGARDVVSTVIDSFGGPGVLFHGISVKPGKPTIGAVINNIPVFGLPGHPTSAMVVFELMVSPLILKGNYPATEEELHMEFPLRAQITRNMSSAAGREDFIRVKLTNQKDELLAEPILGKSGLISTMVKADGLARIPSGKEGVEAGETVQVKLF